MEIAEPWELGILLFLIIFIILLSFKNRDDSKIIYGKIIGAAVLVVFSFFTLAHIANRYALEQGPIVRTSIGSGAWLLVLGGYIVINHSVKKINHPVLRVLLQYSFLLGILILALTGYLNELSLTKEFLAKEKRFFQEFANHLTIAFTSVGLALIIAVPFGVLAYRNRIAEKPIFYAVNTAQTIPSLALFGLLIAPLSFLSTRFPALRSMGIRGIGTAPALIALTLYALLPITINTYTSLKMINPAIIEAGRGMGFNRRQLLFTIEIPLAAPVLLNGIRLAAVQAIGNTAVAALIGAGGLGFFIFQGLGQAASDLILLGAIPVVLLAVLCDRVLQILIWACTPKGIYHE